MTDSEILDLRDDFVERKRSCGQDYDEVDFIGFARAILAAAPVAAQEPTDQQIVDTLARHGIGWMYASDVGEVTPYPLDGEDAPIYIGAARELLALQPAQEPIADLGNTDGRKPAQGEFANVCKSAICANSQPAQGERHKVPCTSQAGTICPQPAYCHANGCKVAQGERQPDLPDGLCGVSLNRTHVQVVVKFSTPAQALAYRAHLLELARA